jgi:hypothetical protein
VTTSGMKALADLGKAGQDPRSADQYARDLATEAERSLAQDPSRWPWRTSSEVPDNRGRSHDLQVPASAAGAPAAMAG